MGRSGRSAQGRVVRMLVVFCVSIGTVCLAETAPSAERGALVKNDVYLYLANNTLVRTDEALSTWRASRIAPGATVGNAASSSLALSRDRRTLWVLSSTSRVLVAVSPKTLAVRRTIKMPVGQQPRAVAVGPRTGRIYLAYVVEHPDPKLHDPPRDARVRVLNPAGTQRLSDTLIRSAAGKRSWFVHTLTLNDAERDAYLSYHGSNTTGLDSISIAGSRLTRCRKAALLGCWGQPHGSVQVVGEHVYAATGAPWVAEYTSNGELERRLETGLGAVHLMELVMSVEVV